MKGEDIEPVSNRKVNNQNTVIPEWFQNFGTWGLGRSNTEAVMSNISRFPRHPVKH